MSSWAAKAGDDTGPLSEEMLAEGPGTRTAHRLIPPALLVGG